MHGGPYGSFATLNFVYIIYQLSIANFYWFTFYNEMLGKQIPIFAQPSKLKTFYNLV